MPDPVQEHVMSANVFKSSNASLDIVNKKAPVPEDADEPSRTLDPQGSSTDAYK